jgi:PAS domain S-box-containing protein
MTSEIAAPNHAGQVLVDRNGDVRLWSEDCERLFGYPASQAIGRPVDFIVPPKYHGQHWRGFHAAMERVETDRPHGVGNIPVVHADGSVHAHPFRQIILFDAFGRATGAIVIFSDALQPGERNGLRNAFFDALPQDIILRA